jgi:CRP/FNR family transcriptional regulator, cyclic AMP receptor protein
VPMPLEEEARLLSLVDVFEPLSGEDLEELAGRCPDIHLGPGEDFYRFDKHDGGLFLIKEGRVRVYKVTPSGKQLTLASLGAGTALSARRLRGAYAQVAEPSLIAFVGREDLKRLIGKEPEVGLRLADLLSERLRLSDDLVSDVIYKEVPARLASLLLQLLQSEGVVGREGYVIQGPYTHEELGMMIGARRVAITRAFKRLREAGVVDVERHRIRIKDPEALRRLASEER